MEKVIVIFGPTGIGKSKTAVNLAKELNGEIISCDSMQIYKGLDVGTAKISCDEMDGIKHHLIDIIEPSDQFSVGDYVVLAREKIKDIISRKKVPIIVGGTGLYINALKNNFDFGNAGKSDEIRKKYEIVLKEKGKDFLYNLLKEKNPSRAEKIEKNDTKRVIRALEIEENKKEIANEKEDNYQYIIFGLSAEREKIYDNINKRTEKMFNDGLIEEVKKLMDSGVKKDAQSMQGIGYKEVISGLENGNSVDEIKELIKRKTRNYAKRQLTFMRGMKDLIWVDASCATQKILEVLNEC
ncbi:MAG: tRNA (adenosine(37)-N6)-dimethylallyltransferase MiaA [Christensenellales bacterium]